MENLQNNVCYQKGQNVLFQILWSLRYPGVFSNECLIDNHEHFACFIFPVIVMLFLLHKCLWNPKVFAIGSTLDLMKWMHTFAIFVASENYYNFKHSCPVFKAQLTSRIVNYNFGVFITFSTGLHVAILTNKNKNSFNSKLHRNDITESQWHCKRLC